MVLVLLNFLLYLEQHYTPITKTSFHYGSMGDGSKLDSIVLGAQLHISSKDSHSNNKVADN